MLSMSVCHACLCMCTSKRLGAKQCVAVTAADSDEEQLVDAGAA